MSSLRVRTKNKLLTVFGASKPSTNVAYDLAYSDFESTLQRLITLDAALKSYASSLQTFHNSASSVVGAVDSLSSGGSGISSYQQETGGASAMQQFADEARVACADVDMVVLQEAYGELELEVLIPVKGWLQHARNLQTEALTFQAQKALYDHYARKVAGLRETHEKRYSTGKMEKTKDTERLFRNEQKLATTTQEYTRLSDTVIRNLRAFVVSRDATLAPLLRRILRGRVVYTERLHEATSCLRALVDDGMEECEDGGMLGHFTRVAQNGSHVGSEAVMAAVTLPPKIRKSSFDAFVGESLSRVQRPHHGEDNWDAFASPPEENKTVSEPHYTPPHAVPQYRTATAASNGRDWAGEVVTPVYPTLVDTSLRTELTTSVSPTSVALNYFPQTSAPVTDLLSRVHRGTDPTLNHVCRQPVTEFRDMHLSALGGDSSSFR